MRKEKNETKIQELVDTYQVIALSFDRVTFWICRFRFDRQSFEEEEERNVMAERRTNMHEIAET